MLRKQDQDVRTARAKQSGKKIPKKLNLRSLRMGCAAGINAGVMAKVKAIEYRGKIAKQKLVEANDLQRKLESDRKKMEGRAAGSSRVDKKAIEAEFAVKQVAGELDEAEEEDDDDETQVGDEAPVDFEATVLETIEMEDDVDASIAQVAQRARELQDIRDTASQAIAKVNRLQTELQRAEDFFHIYRSMITKVKKNVPRPVPHKDEASFKDGFNWGRIQTVQGIIDQEWADDDSEESEDENDEHEEEEEKEEEENEEDNGEDEEQENQKGMVSEDE
ncbi:hypothetical protein BT63DRAFT_326640 [Microthyrium microscopicum]|uniref:Uncharacterized protein n=1 Tax=Microthyrium microscopicum TaxID=703497 RepID=A0A6A6U7R7_9PEZI|nr:hypothetical protein BT63DRAFT_326640 [Microthyrium microscopicum]